MINSADSDQLDLDLHCLLRRGMSCSAREGLRSIYPSVVRIFSVRESLLDKTMSFIPFKIYQMATYTVRV